jgi:hypothetical protein
LNFECITDANAAAVSVLDREESLKRDKERREEPKTKKNASGSV